MPLSPLERETPRRAAQPDAFRLREFQELRATIRERGHVRVIVSLVTFVSWAAVVLTTSAASVPPLFLVPLLVLAAGFETVYAIHVGVERIGRYLYVFYESEAGMPKWETAIAAFGLSAAARATGGSALFVPLFVLAAMTNLLLASVAVFPRAAGLPDATLLGALAAVHGAFIARVFIARRRAARQRALDTTAFRAVAAQGGEDGPTESN